MSEDARIKQLVGQRVREERIAAGYSRLDDFATAIGVDPTNLSRIERGERGLDSLVLARIAGVLNVPMDAFFDAERGQVLAMARGGDGQQDPMVMWGVELLEDMSYVERVVDERGW